MSKQPTWTDEPRRRRRRPMPAVCSRNGGVDEPDRRHRRPCSTGAAPPPFAERAPRPPAHTGRWLAASAVAALLLGRPGPAPLPRHPRGGPGLRPGGPRTLRPPRLAALPCLAAGGLRDAGTPRRSPRSPRRARSISSPRLPSPVVSRSACRWCASSCAIAGPTRWRAACSIPCTISPKRGRHRTLTRPAR